MLPLRGENQFAKEPKRAGREEEEEEEEESFEVKREEIRELKVKVNKSAAGSLKVSSSSSSTDGCSTTSSESESESTSSSSSSNNSNQTTAPQHLSQASASKREARLEMRPKSGENGASKKGGLPQDVITSSESVKRYKNSPFGLTHHYLTMPEVEPGALAGGVKQQQVAKKNKRRNKKSSSSAKQKFNVADTNVDEEVRSLSNSSSNDDEDDDVEAGQTHNDDEAHDDLSSSQACDLSVASSADNSLSRHQAASWQKQAQVAPLGLHHHHHHHHGANFLPAGDAGLDAKKCNAKDASECFYREPASATGHHQLPIDLQAKKMKLGAELKGQDDATDSGGLLVKFSSIMYATFLVILGCILHVSELRQKSKNSSDHIYTIIVALVGLIWLLYLQMDLQRYKRYASKYILIETIFNDHRQKRRELASAQQVNDPSARSTTSSNASLVHDRISMNTEVIFKKTAYKMYQQRAAFEHLQHEQQRKGGGTAAALHKRAAYLDTHQDRPGFDIYKSPASSSSSASFAKESQLSAVNAPLDECSQQQLIPAYKFLHGKMGANFYLKCGMAAFCFGHVIHEGLRFGQQVYFFATGNAHCRDSAALVAHLVTPLYSFYQLFMMFKYSNLVINRHKILARFGLMHIIGTSITFWVRTILEEAFEDFVHKMDYFKTNKPQLNLMPTKTNDNDSNLVSLLNSISNAIKMEASERSDWSIASPTNGLDPIGPNITRAQSLLTLMSSPISATITPQMVRHLPDSYACAQNTLLTTKSLNALPYLYPFTIEYNLLLAATFLSLYFNIGKLGISSESEAACRPFLFSSSRHHHLLPKEAGGSGSSSASPASHIGSSDIDSSAMRMRAESGGSNASRSEKEFGEYRSNFVVNADCHSANKGLFCGFFVLLVTLVTIVIFFVTINKPTHVQLGIKINLIQEATLTALILIVTLAGFKQVVKLNRNPYLKDKVTTDDVLMLIPLPFFFIHSLLSFRAETASMSSGSMSYFSSILIQGGGTGGNNQHLNNHPQDSTGTLQSILLSTTLNNNTKIESRSRLNSLLMSHLNGTNGQFVEDFISNTKNKSNNSNSNSNSSRNSIGSDSSFGRNSRNISNIDAGSNSSHVDHFKLITVALNIIVMIEVLVQTNFIIDGMRRCSESQYWRFKKPGRELITFAILLNITYWIVATFETKSVEQYKTEIEYYGPLPYMFISHTTLPVMLFYRYHSSVCLAEIWNRAYKPPKRR